MLYRMTDDHTEVFLVHPGGPYWAGKDERAWSIPKGIVGPREDRLAAARREFREETGFAATGNFKPLGTFRQSSGKQLTVWALEGDCGPTKLVSNSFSMIWPPKTGSVQLFPEVDRGAWCGRDAAMARIVPGQRPILQAFFDQSRAWRQE